MMRRPSPPRPAASCRRQSRRFRRVYPPQVSVFFQPLSQLSYGWATIVWSLVSAAVYALACVVV